MRLPESFPRLASLQEPRALPLRRLFCQKRTNFCVDHVSEHGQLLRHVLVIVGTHSAGAAGGGSAPAGLQTRGDADRGEYLWMGRPNKRNGGDGGVAVERAPVTV